MKGEDRGSVRKNLLSSNVVKISVKLQLIIFDFIYRS